ncbi:SGNH/GDSL hydrolase family protein [Corynebacterium mendelii]|uniref:SGNH/GDSL hydrolase family protein n=1 Tax=Corynebacterium mendelii TaxID=2765362 RepID=A0A939DYJ0_9CORY|nr:SGNH/GDSL hydrolase family protein [Corynebacterium mendelii]MBN9643170.1 SGNH/GDSL hydrolase family protein [Corynebacterium mendelii]
MTITRALAACLFAVATATVSLPAAVGATSSDPAGFSSTGSAQALISGHYGLGEFNKSAASSWNAAEPQAPAGGFPVLVFGDSHTGGTVLPISADSRGCMHSARSWPSQLNDRLGGNAVLDASCWGSGLNSGHGIPLADQVRYAESVSGLGQSTRDIIIQMGFNDTWSGHGTTMLETAVTCITNRAACNRGHAPQQVINPADITADSYVARLKPVTDYLAYYAPNATIHLLGYASLNPAGDPAVCATIAGAPLRLAGTELVGEEFAALHKAQQQAAARLGLDFIDLSAATAGHHSCSADPWISGIGDIRAGLGGAIYHPSVTGNRVAGDLVASRLR